MLWTQFLNTWYWKAEQKYYGNYRGKWVSFSRCSTTVGEVRSEELYLHEHSLAGDIKHPCHFTSIHREVLAASAFSRYDHFISMYTGETKGTWANVRVWLFLVLQPADFTNYVVI